jgi:protein-S-isoprenylcysteine O-methyltransferase Ste14
VNRKAELIKAVVILPGSVLVFIPAGIVYVTRSVHLLCGAEFPAAGLPLAAGLALVSGGLVLAKKTVSLFFTVGEGTPAPWAPPRRFVVQGPYAYVRNPMLLAVLAILLGEAILLGSAPVLAWWALFWFINTFYFALFEEPALAKRFGQDYLEYKQHVRRWLPRLTPWKQEK